MKRFSTEKIISQARKYRAKGKSYRDISLLLNIPKSTAYEWTKDVAIDHRLQILIMKKQREKMLIGRKKQATYMKKLREDREKKLQVHSKNKIHDLSKSELFYFGIALYWAEGFKKEYSLGFVNSDPIMVKLFLSWLYSLGVKKQQITLRIQINKLYETNIDFIEKRWSVILKIPKNQFKKPYFQQSKNMMTYDKDYLGLVRVRAQHSRVLFVQILSWIDAMRLHIKQ